MKHGWSKNTDFTLEILTVKWQDISGNIRGLLAKCKHSNFVAILHSAIVNFRKNIYNIDQDIDIINKINSTLFCY